MMEREKWLALRKAVVKPAKYVHVAKPLITVYNAQLRQPETKISPYRGVPFRRAEEKNLSRRDAIRLGLQSRNFSINESLKHVK